MQLCKRLPSLHWQQRNCVAGTAVPNLLEAMVGALDEGKTASVPQVACMLLLVLRINQHAGGGFLGNHRHTDVLRVIKFLLVHVDQVSQR